MGNKLNELTIGKAFLIGLVLTAVYYFALYDDGARQKQQIEKFRNEIRKNQNELNKINQAVKDAREYQELQQTLGTELDRIVVAIPKELNDRDLMRTLSEEAKNVGLNITSLNSTNKQNNARPAPRRRRGRNQPEETEEKFIEEIVADLELSGTYSQIMVFMSNLTKLNRIVTISELNVSSTVTKENVSTPQISLKGKFVGYKFVPPAEEQEADNKKGAKQ